MRTVEKTALSRYSPSMTDRTKSPVKKVAKNKSSGTKLRVIQDAPGKGKISDKAIERWLSSLPRARELVRAKG